MNRRFPDSSFITHHSSFFTVLLRGQTMTLHRLLAAGLGVLALAVVPAARGADPDADAKALAAAIDRQVAAAWGKDVKPAPVADDAEFFRRVHLDLAGRIPSVTEVRDFLDDDRPDKRRLWVDRILRADPEDDSYRDTYAAHFANVWRSALMAQTNQQALIQQPALELWLRERLRTGAGYDQLVRDLLTQPAAAGPRTAVPLGGGPADGSPAAYFAANESRPENLAGSTARLFLGVSLECAQCHDHPFAKWTREQFWEYAAFFTDLPPVGRANPQGGRQPALPRGEIKIMGTEKVARAKFLDGAEPEWKGPGTRTTLVDWMTAPGNPFFARAAVNRVWAHFFGVPLVGAGEGEGDGAEPPAAHAALLDELARAFAAHNYDVKFLAKAITASQTYQRTSAVSDPGHKDAKLFARMPLRGLSPEQLFDSLAVATEFRDPTPADPLANLRGGPQSPRGQFLAKFPGQLQPTDYQTSILQALYLMNNEFVADRTDPKKNRTLATLIAQRTDSARKIESLYLIVLSRKPRPGETERLVRYVDTSAAARQPEQALADVFWVLLNSPEFLLNH
jgi:hypothetical protein